MKHIKKIPLFILILSFTNDMIGQRSSKGDYLTGNIKIIDTKKQLISEPRTDHHLRIGGGSQ